MPDDSLNETSDKVRVPMSLLSVGGSVTAQATGLDVVGEVMGSCVRQFSWQNWLGCGLASATGNNRVLYQISAPIVTYPQYLAGVREGYRLALNRLQQEATTLGADGVIGIELSVKSVADDQREYLAIGTAVRARSKMRPARPFLTDLSGTAVSQLMSAGWMAATMLVGLSVSIRHEDWVTAGELFRGSPNSEIESVSELVEHARSSARKDVGSSAAAVGVDGVLVNGFSQRLWGRECLKMHDHFVEVFLSGTGIVRFGRRDKKALDPHARMVMPMTDAR